MLLHFKMPASGLSTWILPFIIGSPVWVHSCPYFQGYQRVAAPPFDGIHSCDPTLEAFTSSQASALESDYTNLAHAEPYLANSPAHPYQYNHQAQESIATGYSQCQSHEDADSANSYKSHNVPRDGYELALLPSSLNGRSHSAPAQGALKPSSQQSYWDSHDTQAHDLGLHHVKSVNPDHQLKPHPPQTTTEVSGLQKNHDTNDGSDSQAFVENRLTKETFADLAQSFSEIPQNALGSLTLEPLGHEAENEPAQGTGFEVSNSLALNHDQPDAWFRHTTASLYGHSQNSEVFASAVPQPMMLSSYGSSQKIVANQHDVQSRQQEFANTDNAARQRLESAVHSNTDSQPSTSIKRLDVSTSLRAIDEMMKNLETRKTSIMKYVHHLRDLLKACPGSTQARNKCYPNEFLSKYQLRYLPPSCKSRRKGFIRVMKDDHKILGSQQLETKFQGLLGWVWDYQDQLSEQNEKNDLDVQSDLFKWLWTNLTKPKYGIPVIGHVKPFTPDEKVNIGAIQGILIKYFTEKQGFISREVAKALVDIRCSKSIEEQVQATKALRTEVHELQNISN